VESRAKTLFQDILPKGQSITLYQWRERRPGGEEFHARYVLTEKIGISIDAGLSAGEKGESTDWRLLIPTVCAQRWAALQAGAGVYELVERPLTLDAQGKCVRG
jgi:hypothetical protein